MSKTIFLKLFFILLFGMPKIGTAQTKDEDIRLKVLRKNSIGKEFVFGKWDERKWDKIEGTETHLTYLGSVKTQKGKTYKIMNSVWIWGLSCRATNRILIFNGKNQYIGNYYVTTETNLPTELKNGILIFRNTDPECNKRIISKVSLKNGLPITIFTECKNGYGDSFTFEGD
ncbi:hypothetical protein [Flavobacterium hungaricum]|uniref:Uncharacterized protein n=1 Tax=Flavobacterium hungaricum TaxID=2082725 RepID=A0ABR9TJF8_9FLAO|nr:hypothetical protein [Flavobacterium hungaricum]MBE8725489.1 hypothetical protein [Flavobacterium hungaricum]